MRNAVIVGFSFVLALAFCAGLSYLCAGCADKPAPVAAPKSVACVSPIPVYSAEVAKSPVFGAVDQPCTPPPPTVFGAQIFQIDGKRSTGEAVIVYALERDKLFAYIVRLSRANCTAPWLMQDTGYVERKSEWPAGEVL